MTQDKKEQLQSLTQVKNKSKGKISKQNTQLPV